VAVEVGARVSRGSSIVAVAVAVAVWRAAFGLVPGAWEALDSAQPAARRAAKARKKVSLATGS
jgi:hypothetical protein